MDLKIKSAYIPCIAHVIKYSYYYFKIYSLAFLLTSLGHLIGYESEKNAFATRLEVYMSKQAKNKLNSTEGSSGNL